MIILLTLKSKHLFRIIAKLVPKLFRCVKLSIKTHSESSGNNKANPLQAKVAKMYEFAITYLFGSQTACNFADYFILANQTFSMKIFISVLLAVACSVSSASAQQGLPVCGNTTAQQIEHMLPRVRTYQQQVLTSERNEVQYIPIFFHLTADAAGEGRHKDRFVLDQLCDMNEAYAPMDFRFYIKPHTTYGLIDRSINSNSVYSGQTNEFLMNSRRNQNALNVYVVNQVFDDPSILGFNNSDRDWVVARKDQINGNGNGTLPHEVGHFFALPHTFLGYESNPFDGVNDPTWPVAPVVSPGGPLTERADGSNCQSAADEICDTPEDYNFGYGANGCATYTGAALDPLSNPVDPMENNFMGYFIGCTDYQFTPGQVSVVLSDRASNDRNYLDNTYTPAAEEISVPDNLLISPIGGATQEFYDEVLLQWQSVPGATYYLIEFDISTFFATTSFQSVIVPATTTSLLYTTLQANRNYYWRVRPFNEYVTCAPAKTSSFRTPTTSAVKSIEDLNAWNIYPNPVSPDDKAYVAIQADNGFTTSLSIVNPAGEMVYEQNGIDLGAGNTTLEISTSGLANGVYFVVLSTEKGRAVRKLTVLK